MFHPLNSSIDDFVDPSRPRSSIGNNRSELTSSTSIFADAGLSKFDAGFSRPREEGVDVAEAAAAGALGVSTTPIPSEAYSSVSTAGEFPALEGLDFAGLLSAPVDSDNNALTSGHSFLKSSGNSAGLRMCVEDSAFFNERAQQFEPVLFNGNAAVVNNGADAADSGPGRAGAGSSKKKKKVAARSTRSQARATSGDNSFGASVNSQTPPALPPKKKNRRATAAAAAASFATPSLQSVSSVTVGKNNDDSSSSTTSSNKRLKGGRKSAPSKAASSSAADLLSPVFLLSKAKPPLHPRVVKAHARLQELRVSVAKIKGLQERLSLPLSATAQKRQLSAIGQQQTSLIKDIQALVKECDSVHQSFILHPIDMYKRQVVLSECSALLAHVELLGRELDEICKHPDRLPPPQLALVITQQPFPKTLMQNRVVEEDCVLELLCGAKTTVANFQAMVTAEMVVDYRTKKKDELEVKNGSVQLEAPGIARFSKLKFTHGTKKNPAVLKFSAQVNCATGSTTAASSFVDVYVESPPSHAFVVKTNEKQWQESEALILQRAVFDNRPYASWEHFINCIHAHHLHSTRQQLHEPSRPLVDDELDFIRNLLEVSEEAGARAVTQKTFDACWQWLGPIEHKLRHRRHLCALWGTGMIAGFLSRNEAERALEEAAIPGGFLIRFSERYAGEFVISYSTRSLLVKHYLLRPDEANSPSDTLPDFIRAHADALQVLLAIELTPHDEGCVTSPLGSRAFRRLPIEPILEKFCKPAVEKTDWGYEESVNSNLERLASASKTPFAMK